MSGQSVSVGEFERWAKLQADIQNEHSRQLKEISTEISKTNDLLKDDIAVTKSMLETHIVQYNADKEKNSDTFSDLYKATSDLKEIIKEREDVYRAGKALKWGGVVVITAMLAAGGKSLYDNISFTKQEQVDETQR